MDGGAFDLVIFDWDGTLMDSLDGIVFSMNLALADHGLAAHFSRERVAAVVGLSLERAIAELLPGEEAETVARVVAHYKNHFRRMADHRQVLSPLFPGARELLARLRQAGKLLAVATGKSMAGLRRNLADQELETWFDAIKTADCAPSKPHPGMIEGILAETGVAATRALMVGDTSYDVEMGRNAGVWCCAVTFGCHDRARLGAAKPHFWAESLEEVGEIALARELPPRPVTPW